MEQRTSLSLTSRFLRGTAAVGFGNVMVMVLGLISMMIVARYLPTEAFGTFVLLQVVVAFLMRMSSLGIGMSITRSISAIEDDEQRKLLVNSVILFRVLLIPLVSLIAFFALPFLIWLFNAPLLGQLFIFIPLMFFTESLGTIFKEILQGLFRFGRVATTDIALSLINFVLLVVLIVGFEQGIIGLIIARVTAQCIAYGTLYFAIPVQKALHFDLRQIRELIWFGLPLQVNDIFTFIFLRIDTIMIGALLGPTGVALYEFARRIPESIAGIYEAFRAVFFPFISRLFAEQEMSQANALLNHSIRLLVFTTTSGALIALLFGDTIITILFSERYLESVPAFILLMFGLSFTFMDYTMGYSLVAVGDSAKPAMINLVHIMVTLLSNVALIPVLGISGAALASIAGFVAVNPLYAWFLRRRHVVVPVISHLKPVFLFGSMWLLLFLTGFTLDVVYRIVLIIGFLGACLWLSVISRADIMLAIHEAGSILNSRFLRPRSSETQT